MPKGLSRTARNQVYVVALEHQDARSMDLPKNFDDRLWWILLSVAGGLIAPASITVSSIPGFLVGLGLLLFGVGQWIDHPVQTRRAGGAIVTGYPWRPTVFGIAISVLGGALFCYGLYRVVA
jgi:hypothetical protein